MKDSAGTYPYTTPPAGIQVYENTRISTHPTFYRSTDIFDHEHPRTSTMVGQINPIKSKLFTRLTVLELVI